MSTKQVVDILVEAVNSKPKFPKFSNGAVLVKDKWINVGKKVAISLFEKGQKYSVEQETNDKGYDTIVGLVLEKTSIVKDSPFFANVVAPAQTNGESKSYQFTEKDERIVRQGLIQAALQSPALFSKEKEEAWEVAKYLYDQAKKVVVE